MIIALSGLSGTGKDTAADILVRDHGFVKVSLADPIKRICRDVFDFTDDQLWGPSEKRNSPDPRYRRLPTENMNQAIALDIDEQVLDLKARGPVHLTPRYALQKLGTEWGRGCYDDIWVEYAVRVAKELLSGYHPEGYATYDAKSGLEHSHADDPKYRGVVISDVRFRNEISGLKKAGAKLIRIKRPGHEQPKWDHPSETEQMDIPDEEFNLVINNQDSLEDLAENISFILGNDILNHE